VQTGDRALGLSIPVQDELAITDVLRLVGAAEDEGYDWLVIGEIAGPEVFAVLGAAAVSTRRIGLATGVLSIYGRSPSLMAMGFATLDALAPGRIMAGVGASSAMIAGWHGREFDRPVRRMRDTVAGLRAVLTGERVDIVDGETPTPAFRLTPGGASIPVLVAAIQPRMLELAAQIADVVYLAFCPDDQIGHHVAAIRQAEVAAGRAPGSVAIGLTLNAYAGDDLERADDRIRRFLLNYAALPTHGPAFKSLAARMAEPLALAAAGERDRAAAAIDADVVSLVCAIGSGRDVFDRVRSLWDRGIDLVALHALSPDRRDAAATEQTMVNVAAARRAAHPGTTAGGGSA